MMTEKEKSSVLDKAGSGSMGTELDTMYVGGGGGGTLRCMFVSSAVPTIRLASDRTTADAQSLIVAHAITAIMARRNEHDADVPHGTVAIVDIVNATGRECVRSALGANKQ